MESRNKLWGAHIQVPAGIASQLLRTENKRVRCAINGSEEFQAGLIPQRGMYVITVNKSRRAILGLQFGEKVRVSLLPDNSTFGLPMPEELEELLRQDREGKSYFDALTAGKKRTLLYFVGSIKKPDKRMSRALIVVDHLKKHKGVINYKVLYSSLRDPSPRR